MLNRERNQCWGAIQLNNPMLAGHADPKTTRLYDRRRQTVSLDEVERIGI